MKQEQIVIIGSGPAGLTAALYMARAQLEPLVISGSQLGGQISITSEVENYPGFPQGTTGPELVELMRAQAETFGARLVIDEVTEVDFSHGPPFAVKSHSETYQAKAVIVTVGASPLRLGVPGEEESAKGCGRRRRSSAAGVEVPRTQREEKPSRHRGTAKRRESRNRALSRGPPLTPSGGPAK